MDQRFQAIYQHFDTLEAVQEKRHEELIAASQKMQLRRSTGQAGTETRDTDSRSESKSDHAPVGIRPAGGSAGVAGRAECAL